MRLLLTGNEAIARGAWEGGVTAAFGYPGTPSTEILENLVRYDGVYCEWSPNEKVALEAAAGASIAGARCIVTMKLVGLNVAADPLMTLSYVGVRGGLVVCVADDPGQHSSQTEQDTRHYARLAKIPVLDPADAVDARAFMLEAFELSEKYMNDHFDEFNAQLNADAEKLDPKQPQKMRWLMAGADWVFDKIHEYGGMAIFAHPFWHAVMRENLPQPVREYIMKERKFDAIELIGLSANMQSREDNMVNVNWWMQENMKSGKMIPVVGNTDSHGARGTLNRRATIVFAKDKSFESIAEGIRSGHSVAGQFYDGEGPVLFGDYRLVDFAYFLCREFYPEHDEESKLLGSVLMDHLRGGCDDATVKAVGKNRLTKLFAKYWAK